MGEFICIYVHIYIARRWHRNQRASQEKAGATTLRIMPYTARQRGDDASIREARSAQILPVHCRMSAGAASCVWTLAVGDTRPASVISTKAWAVISKQSMGVAGKRHGKGRTLRHGSPVGEI